MLPALVSTEMEKQKIILKDRTTKWKTILHLIVDAAEGKADIINLKVLIGKLTSEY